MTRSASGYRVLLPAYYSISETALSGIDSIPRYFTIMIEVIVCGQCNAQRVSLVRHIPKLAASTALDAKL